MTTLATVPKDLGKLVKIDPKQMTAHTKPYFRVKIYRRGTKYHALGHLVMNGEVETFRACFDTASLARALAQQASQQAQVSGFFSSIGKFVKKTVRKVGRAKVLKAITRGARAVIRSKITGAAIGVLAVAYPPVGLPAAAAYAAANKAIDVVEKGQRAAKQVDKIASQLRRGKRRITGRVRRGRYKGKRVAFSSKLLKRKLLRLRNAMVKKRKVQLRLNRIAKIAKLRRPSKKRNEARRVARVFSVVIRNKAALKSIQRRLKGGTRGLVITRSAIRRGKWVRSFNKRYPIQTMMHQGRAVRGRFRPFQSRV